MTVTDEPTGADYRLAKASRGLRSWLRLQVRRGRTDHVAAAYRLLGGREDIFERTSIKRPKRNSVLGMHAALERALEHADLERADRMDLIATLNHWEEMITEWRIDRDAARAMAGKKGLGMVSGDPHPAPSVEHPVAVKMCVIPTCRRTAVYGADRCELHGGDWMDPATRQAMLLDAFEDLVSASKTAVSTLVHVMEHSKRDDARVAAAREVLDRVGIRPGNEIHIHVHDGEETEADVQIIRDRLTEMHRALELGETTLTKIHFDEDIVDAEVIEDTDEPDEPDETAPAEEGESTNGPESG